MTAGSPAPRSPASLFHRLCGTSSALHDEGEEKRSAWRLSKSSSVSSEASQGRGGASHGSAPPQTPNDTLGRVSRMSGLPPRIHTSDSSNSLQSQGSPKLRQLPGSKLLAEYISEQTLGFGSSGKVWLCRCINTGARYALKEIRKSGTDSKKKLLKNSFDTTDSAAGERMASTLPSHPNVLRVHEVISAMDCRNTKVVMEPALGGDLSALELHTGGLLNEDRLAGIMWQVLQGLRFLHSMNIVHGDMKPGNMLLGGEKDSVVKLADLGCAERFPEGQDPSTWWVRNRPGGTPAYLSPEQTTEEPYLGAPADVWALGVSMYQLATKEMPFRRESIMGLYLAIAADPVPRLEDIRLPPSPELYGLLVRMLDKDAESRITLAEVASHPWFRKRGFTQTAK